MTQLRVNCRMEGRALKMVKDARGKERLYLSYRRPPGTGVILDWVSHQKANGGTAGTVGGVEWVSGLDGSVESKPTSWCRWLRCGRVGECLSAWEMDTAYTGARAPTTEGRAVTPSAGRAEGWWAATL